MAWRCSAHSNGALVENLQNAGIITMDRVKRAMMAVDRGKYVRDEPYQDAPQAIGHGATISAPHMHAYALQSLEPFLQTGMKALDVGSGSGYLTACFAEMVGPDGVAVGIDHIPELVQESERNVRGDQPELLKSGRVKLVVGDGRKGYPEKAPYDCIHVGAAAPEEPKALIDQLKAPGRMFIPMGVSIQQIYQFDKDRDGHVSKKPLMHVMYVPLTDAPK